MPPPVFTNFLSSQLSNSYMCVFPPLQGLIESKKYGATNFLVKVFATNIFERLS